MALRRWVCENCMNYHPHIRYIWDCVGCNKEICERCFGVFAHCVDCSYDKDDKELRDYANKNGFEFSSDDEDCLCKE